MDENNQKCPNCGEYIDNNDKYCQYCGYKIKDNFVIPIVGMVIFVLCVSICVISSIINNDSYTNVSKSTTSSFTKQSESENSINNENITEISNNNEGDHGKSQLAELLKQIDEQIKNNGWYYYQSGTIDDFEYVGTETIANNNDLYEIWNYTGETPYETVRYCIQTDKDKNIYFDSNGFLNLASKNGKLTITFENESVNSDSQAFVTYKYDEGVACTVAIYEGATGVGCEYYDDELRTVSHITLLKKVNIRNGSGVNHDLIGVAEEGSILPFYEVAQADGYTWYRISNTNNKWIADDGTWLKVETR